MSRKEVIAKYSSFGKKFEVLVDSEKISDYKSGKLPLTDIVIGNGIFLDLSSAVRAPKEVLLQVFKTDDFERVASEIIRRGEIQLTQDARRELLEQKKRKIIAHISANCIDVRTNAPLPPGRVETAMNEAKVRIDPFESAESQIKCILSALAPIIPIRFETRRVAFKIPIKLASQCKNSISRIGTIIKESWSESFWLVETEFPAGMQDGLFGKLNSITHGDIESKIL